MTAAQEKDIRDHTHTIGYFLADLNRNKARATYWCIHVNMETITVDGHAAFSSYGEAKHFARLYLKNVLMDIKFKKVKKDDRYAKESLEYLKYLNSLEGDEYERAVIELRDLLIETGVFTIKEEEY